MKKAFFNIDGDSSQPSYEGLCDGSTWNGWAMPYFTKEVGLQIVKDFNQDEQIDSVLKYSATENVFKELTVDNDDFYIDIFQPILVGGIEYFQIGNGYCWAEVEQ
jgi:hypothetical protein